MKKKRKVVITGLGLATPLGLGLEESWKLALEGVSGIRELGLPGADKSPVQAAGRIKDEDWSLICSTFPDEAGLEGERRTLYALWSARSAMEDAGLALSRPGRHGLNGRWGVALAAGLGINRLEDVLKWTGPDNAFDFRKFADEYASVHPGSLMKNSSDRPSALLAERFGFGGINYTATSACASATQAIGTAFRAIRRGDADLMLAGGTDSMINPVGLVFFVLLSAAAVSTEKPSELCRPFDRKRSGLVMGEGSGIAVLEEESHALKRGARIYAEAAGYGSSIDAYKVTAPDPKGIGAAASMSGALSDAEMGTDSVDYINAHGTSTKLNDSAETRAIRNVFGKNADNISINSSKSLIGHLIAASGGPEFVFTTLSVNRDEIHPTINLTYPDPKCDLDYVPDVKRERPVRAAISNSFGFGGQNASIVVRKYII